MVRKEFRLNSFVKVDTGRAFPQAGDAEGTSPLWPSWLAWEIYGPVSTKYPRNPNSDFPFVAEEAPGGLEGADGLLDEDPDPGVGTVRETDRVVCPLVVLVCPAGDAGLGECLDDAVLLCVPE